MEDVPEQEDVCVVDGLGSKEIVSLDRNSAILDRLGLALIPVLHVDRQHMWSDIGVCVEVLTAMARSLTLGRS